MAARRVLLWPDRTARNTSQTPPAATGLQLFRARPPSVAARTTTAGTRRQYRRPARQWSAACGRSGRAAHAEAGRTPRLPDTAAMRRGPRGSLEPATIRDGANWWTIRWRRPAE